MNLVQVFSAIALTAIATLFPPSPVHASTSDESASRPNIIIILVDDMGYGDPGCYNSESKIPTPHIDSLAAAGMRFTDAHASGPLCHVSRYGLMTGRYPFRAKVGQWSSNPTIDEDRPTIASLLRSARYSTAMVGKWHLGFAENGYDKPLPGGPVDRGFDSYFGIRASTDIPPYFYIRGNQAVSPPTNTIAANNSEGWSPIQGAFWREGGIAPGLELKDVLPRFTQEAIDVISNHSTAANNVTQPLFLYLAYPAPHTPWLPDPQFIGKTEAGMYGDFAAMVDDHVGQVLKAIETADMKQNTLVILTSDNGPVWYEDDVTRFSHDSSGGLRGMKADAWECGHRMPFIVRWPGVVSPGSRSDALVSFVDLYATLAELTHQELADNAAPDSFSFLKQLTQSHSSDAPQRQFLALQSGGKMMTMRSGPWKLIRGLGSGGFSQPKKIKPVDGQIPVQLYNLAEDLAETNNVAASHPEIVQQLSELLDQTVAAEGQRFLQ